MALSDGAPLSSAGLNRLVIATSSYNQVGQLSSIAISAGRVKRDGAAIHSDAIVRAPLGDDVVYVVNRYGADNIQVVSKDLKKTLNQFSVGRETNPQDIAVIDPRKAYVSRLNAKTLLKVNPLNGKILKEIDLSSMAYARGVPQMAHLLLLGKRLFVQLQRLDDTALALPGDYSSLVEINTDTDAGLAGDSFGEDQSLCRFQAAPGAGLCR